MSSPAAPPGHAWLAEYALLHHKDIITHCVAKRWDLFSLGICTARVFAGAVRSFVLTNTFEHYKAAVQILDALHHDIELYGSEPGAAAVFSALSLKNEQYVLASVALRCQPILSALSSGDSDLAMARINEWLPMDGQVDVPNKALGHLIVNSLQDWRTRLISILVAPDVLELARQVLVDLAPQQRVLDYLDAIEDIVGPSRLDQLVASHPEEFAVRKRVPLGENRDESARPAKRRKFSIEVTKSSDKLGFRLKRGIVTSVSENSPSAVAGLQPGDQLHYIRIKDQTLNVSEEQKGALATLAEMKLNERFTLIVSRQLLDPTDVADDAACDGDEIIWDTVGLPKCFVVVPTIPSELLQGVARRHPDSTS